MKRNGGPRGRLRISSPGELPFWTLAGATLIAGLALAAAVWAAATAPVLGITVAPLQGAPGVRVTSVWPGGPASGALHAGDRIVALASPSGPGLRLRRLDVIDEPDRLADFATFNRFFRRAARAHRILRGQTVEVLLASGRVARIHPAERRPWTSLPAGFWLLVGFGVAAFLLGAAVWGSSRGREGRLPVRLLGLSGVGFLLTASASAVYIERELALDPDLFHALELINQAGILLFAVCGAAVLWAYPRRLTRFPAHGVMLAVAALVWFNLLFQWHDLPVHNVYVPLFAAYLLAVVFSLAQWRMTRRNPLLRAALKWLMLSIFLTTGLALALFFVPALFGYQPLVSAGVAAGIALLMFVGLAAGVTRYRLFDLERWWYEIWLWALTGVAVLALDAFFVFALGIVPLRAFGLAIVLVAWLYIPVRGRLWKWFSSDSGEWWNENMPEVLETVFSAPSRAVFLRRWAGFLRRMYRPLKVRSSGEPTDRSQVLENGICLRVPPLGGGTAVDLQYYQRGTRLFTRRDARLADAFVALATRSLHAFEARERGVANERERIMRDLHDDVGARLLTLSRRCRDPREAALAREALGTLRDTIHSLNMDAKRTLTEALADWRGETSERLEEAGVALGWHASDRLPEALLSGRQIVQLRRILQEAVSNLLRHSSATRAIVVAGFEGGRLRLTIVNDGLRPAAAVTPGHGLDNMAERAADLGGSARYRIIGAGGARSFRLEVAIPLDEETLGNATRIGS